MHDAHPTSAAKNSAQQIQGIEAQARPSITADWNPLRPPAIDGLKICDVKNVVYRNGALTELFRPEWFAESFNVQHVVLVTMLPGEYSQWHCHHHQRDIVFPVRGYIRIGLYDARQDSPTFGKGHVQTFNLQRPRYLYIPTGVWHSLKNIGSDDGQYVVMNDVAYDYEQPDDWTLPPGAPAIPVSLD